MNSAYGKSKHYEGKEGADYFAWQNDGEKLHGKLNLWKFQPWIRATDDVLDFGCGGGWLLSCLEAGSRVGVELNPAARAACNQNKIDAYADVSSIPPQRTFTRIISHHCLEHVPYPVAALQELQHRLTDDGLLILVLPIDDWRAERDYTGKDIDHHLHTWTPRLIANTLSEAGFVCTHAEVLTHAWPYKWKELQAILPSPLFNTLCIFWGFFKKRRQLRAIARKVRP